MASRRLRELLPMVEFSSGGARKTRKRVRRLTRLLGRVREMDVALALLEASSDGVSRVAVFEARQHLHAKRESSRAHLLRKLHKLSVRKFDRRLDDLMEVAAEQDASEWRRTLATHLSHRTGKLRQATSEAGAIYVPERLHAVRLASKKLRYALELAAEMGVRDGARLAALVRRTQVTLGSLQDRHVLLREVNSASAKLSETRDTSGTREGLLTLGARLEREARELHGQFLAQREALAGALDAVRQQIVPELLRGRRKPARAVLKTEKPATVKVRRAG